MVKVIVTLTAAASTMFGQIVQADVKTKPAPVKKEVCGPAVKVKAIFKKSPSDDTKLA